MQDSLKPVNPLPLVVLILFAVIAAVELVVAVGASGLLSDPAAIGWRLKAAELFGFSGQAFDWMIRNRALEPEYLWRSVTYLFIQPTLTSALVMGAIFLAMGKLVGEVLGQVALVTIFLGSGILGAWIFALLTDQAGLIGVSPAVFGLLGSYTFLLWIRLAGTGMRQFSAFQLIAILMGIQLFFGIFFYVGYTWVAELAGFIVGFALSPLLAPGALRHLINRLRQR